MRALIGRTFRIRLAFALAAIGLLKAQATSPQPAVGDDPAISYLASVRPNNSLDARTITEYSPGGRLRAIAVTPRTLVRLAYRVQDYQIAEAPSWFSTRRYDIEAKAEGSPAPSQLALVRALLKDRFKFAAHTEIRDSQRFALVLARQDGKLGRQLIESSFDCAAYAARPHGPPVPGKTPNCAARINLGSLSARAIPMSQLAASLTPFVHRFTVDKTGLAGGFDVELTWTPDTAMLNPTGAVSGDGAAADPGDSSIFTSLQEQLGLKLVSERGPVEMLIIAHAEEPSGN
jgi:bla regulator protein blaR1